MNIDPNSKEFLKEVTLLQKYRLLIKTKLEVISLNTSKPLQELEKNSKPILKNGRSQESKSSTKMIYKTTIKIQSKKEIQVESRSPTRLYLSNTRSKN